MPADLVYTGMGALIWMPDLAGWVREVARLLRPSGHLFVYEAHPAVILWTWDEDRPRIREDRSYFGRSHVNDTFPARGAVEWQWTLGEIVTAVAAAGMEIMFLGEYPEPFWRRAVFPRRRGAAGCRTPSPCSPAGRVNGGSWYGREASRWCPRSLAADDSWLPCYCALQ
jgi:SAM-dependent methyltransferase